MQRVDINDKASTSNTVLSKAQEFDLGIPENPPMGHHHMGFIDVVCCRLPDLVEGDIGLIANLIFLDIIVILSELAVQAVGPGGGGYRAARGQQLPGGVAGPHLQGVHLQTHERPQAAGREDWRRVLHLREGQVRAGLELPTSVTSA